MLWGRRGNVFFLLLGGRPKIQSSEKPCLRQQLWCFWGWQKVPGASLLLRILRVNISWTWRQMLLVGLKKKTVWIDTSRPKKVKLIPPKKHKKTIWRTAVSLLMYVFHCVRCTFDITYICNCFPKEWFYLKIKHTILLFHTFQIKCSIEKYLALHLHWRLQSRVWKCLWGR